MVFASASSEVTASDVSSCIDDMNSNCRVIDDAIGDMRSVIASLADGSLTDESKIESTFKGLIKKHNGVKVYGPGEVCTYKAEGSSLMKIAESNKGSATTFASFSGSDLKGIVGELKVAFNTCTSSIESINMKEGDTSFLDKAAKTFKDDLGEDGGSGMKMRLGSQAYASLLSLVNKADMGSKGLGAKVAMACNKQM